MAAAVVRVEGEKNYENKHYRIPWKIILIFTHPKICVKNALFYIKI